MTLCAGFLASGKRYSSEQYEAYSVMTSLSGKSESETESFLSRYWDDTSEILTLRQGRSIPLKKQRCLGLGPLDTRPGDLVCILCTADTPFILRKKPNVNTYRLIGEAYIHGVMDGEALLDD